MSDVGRWRRIYSNEWHAAAFQGLSDPERQIYFYARTGPQSTSVGIYRMSTAVAVEDIGNLSPVEFDHRLDTVCKAFAWGFDAATRVLWMPTWIEENPPQSPNVCVAWRKLIVNLPDCDLKFTAAAAITEHLKDKPKAFLEAFGKDLPKDFRISKAKPRAKTESYQGTGDSGIQGSERKRTGALRAVASKGKPKDAGLVPTPDDRVIRIARHVIQDGPREPTTDYLIDAVIDTCLRDLNLQVNRATAIVALTLSQQDRTA